MLKRFVARLLIVLQIYGNLFQGVVHAADLAESYPIRNEIHLHSSVDKHGSLRLALGTDGIEDSTELKWFDIPSYQAAKKLAPQIGLSQITEVEVDDENLSNYSDDDAYLSTDDESTFEREGITRNSQAAAFTLQGLKFSISNNGTMVIEGRQTGDHKPIFLNNEAPIILDGVAALALKITAPRVVNTGTSSFKQLIVKGNYIEGEGEDEDRSKTSFINYGNLNAKELFLSACNSVNHQTITAARFEINGKLTSDGSLTSDELILEESAYLRLNEDSRADIKTLFLSKASHFENQQQAEAVLNIGVLYGSDGSLTNLGTMAIDKMEVDSAFQSITNRHFLDIAHGTIKAQQFENHGNFIAEESDLQVVNGQNLGPLKTKGLQVKIAFTNTEAGVVDTSLVSGSGHLHNLGLIETQGDLDVDIKRFTNAEEARIEVTQALGFDQTTFVINQGNMVAKAMTLFASKTTQNGHMTTTTLNLTGGGEFQNLGDIDVDQDLNLERLDSFINKGNVSTKLINGYQDLITLKNDSGALFKVRDGPLDLVTTTTNLINAGTIEAQLLNLNSDQTTLLKSGSFKAPSISLTGVNPFTNPGQIIADYLMATNELVNHGQLVTHRSTQLTKGLTIAADAVADLKGLKLTGGEISNLGKLIITGIQRSDFEEFEKARAVVGITPGQQLVFDRIALMRADRNISGFADLHGVSAEVSGFMDTIMALQPQERDPLLNALGAKVNLVVPRFGRHNPFMSAQIKGAFDFLIRNTKEDIQTARDISIQLSTSKQPAYEQFPRSFFGDEVIKLTNSGVAMIDGQQMLPRLDDRSPENLAVMYGVSPIYPEILEFKEEQAAMRATHEEMQLVRSQIEEIPLKPVMTSGNSIGKINFLISRALNTIAKLPPQDRVTLVTELRDRINLIVPTYSGYDYSILTTAFNGIRDSFVPKIQTAIDFASEQTKRLQLLQLLTYKDLMPEVFQVKGLPEATDALKPFLSKVALSETKDFVEKPEARVYPDIAPYNGIAGKIQASKLKVSCEGREYIGGIDPAIVSINGLVLKVAASRYKEISENPLIVPEQLLSIPVEVTSAEQQFTQQLQEQVEFLQQVSAFKKTVAEIPQIKLQVLNQASGQLTLKSGRFEFVGNNALVNDGTLIQESAYTLWLTSVPGEFNRGTRKVNGSLGLLSLNGSDLGDLQVEDVLHVDTNSEALRALVGLSKVQARRVILQVPTLQKFPESLECKTKTCPWPLELNIAGAIDNNVEISAPELKVKAQSLKTSGNLFSTQAVLELSVAEGAEISASIGGQAGINLSAKKLKLLGRADIPGAVIPNVFYKRNDNGLYAQGPVVLNIAELLDNHYGVIQGSSYTIKAPQLINLAGLITATDPSLSSTINVKEIKNLRDEQGNYTSYHIQRGVTYDADGKNWCYCCGTRPWKCEKGCIRQIPIANSYETSDEGVIFAQGDLTLNYHQLEMLVSRITSGGKLTLISGDKQFTYENAPDIKVLPGTTTMTVRNLHGNHVVAKQDLHVELGNANMATSMQGQNIFVNAGKLTLQNLGLQNKSQGKIVNLLSLMQGGIQGDGHTSSNSNIFKTIGNGDGSDYTDLTLPFKHQSLPTSLVILGQDAHSQLTQNQGIDLQATMRSLEQAMGSQFYTLYRGINGLGLNIHHFFNATSDFVRGHKDTITQRRLIKSGKTEQEVDVQLNPTLTPQDLLNSGILGVFLDFTKNIQGLESTHKAFDDVNQTKQKSALMFAVPADHKKNPGINSPGVIEVTSKGDLGVFTNVKGKDVKLVSTDGSTTVGSETIRHQFGHNYHDQLIPTRIEAQANLLIKGKTDVVMKAIETHSGVQTDIIAQTGMVLDQSLATVDHTVSYSYDKKSSTTTKVTNVHQNTSTHSSDGKVNIKANTGILQYGVKNSNANLDAPIILQEDVHDQRMVESQTISLGSGGGWGRFIGAKERKETNFSESISRSKGCHNSGDSFIAMAKERFKAVNPTFSAKHNEITADEIELKVGTNTHQSYTQSSYQGPIWNKVSQSTENHVTHRNPTFEHNIYLHSPKVILEKVRGSVGTGTFDKIISDSEIITRDVDDIHQSTHKSQKSLSAGASLILSLAVSLATANPFTASSLSAAMLSAGYGTLCSQAAICLVEKDGDPGKAMNELGKRDIGKSMFMSIATAGLTKGLGDKLGITKSIGFENLAKKHLLQSAINTSMAVAIDGQNFEKAMLQGVTSAAINTLAAYGAGKIGDAHDQSNPDRINAATHKLLHGALGGISGGISSQLSGGEFARGALSGAFGGVMGETLAELTGNKQLADLMATSLAFGTGLDSLIAYQTSSNATEYNWKKHQPHPSIMGIIKECTEEDCAEEAETVKEPPKRSQKQEADERRRAKNKAELVKFFSKSLSPVRHDTVLQTEVTKPVKKFIGSMVPDTFKELAHKTGESLGKKAEKSSNAWQDFKQNPSLDKWSTKHALRHGAFETLGALGTGVEYVKAYGRRGLRGMGMDANTAQDTMSVVDVLLMFAGGTKAVSSLGTLSKQTLVSGPKLANKLSEMTKGSGPRIKAYVKDQFNYREHFAAERLRLEGGGLNLPKAGKYFDAEDALGLKPLSTEQPWVVRTGQEWKTKVFGKGQNTKTEGHAFRSYREAIDAAKREDVEAVFLNRGIRKVTNHPIEKPNTRPDVTIRRTDGRVDQIEVPSKSDVDKNLMARMNSTKDRLPECMKGEVDIRRITEQ